MSGRPGVLRSRGGGAPSALLRWRPGPGARTWAVAGGLAVLGAALLAGPVSALPDHGSAPLLGVLAMAVAFALAEVAQVHVHLRGETHTIAFSEVPLVVGVLLVSPWQLALAQLGAAVVARLLWMRQAPVKAVFNIALAMLDLCIVVLLVGHLAPALDPTSPATWLAVICAALLASVSSAACVGLVISASSPGTPLRLLAQTSLPALGVTVVNVATGLALGAVVATSAISALLLLVPAGLLLLAYRAWTAQLQERRRVGFLLDFNRCLHEDADPAEGLRRALELARETLRCRRLEVVLPDVGQAPATLAAVLAPASPAHEQTAARELVDAAAGQARLFTTRARHRDEGRTGRLLAALEVEQAVVAPLRRGAGERGALVALGREGSVARFDTGDVALLGTLAEQLALVLERDRLAGSLDTLRALQDQLVHSATHDALTGLPNRAHLVDHLGAALAAWHPVPGPASGLAALFVDLDGFKGINDRFGHAAGDELLVTLAQRLRALLGPGDLVARLGGDEFVVVAAIPGGAGEEQAAGLLAAGLVRAVTAPVARPGHTASIGVSIGVAVATPEVGSAEELLERADEVMYAVKATGGGVRLYDERAHTARTHRRSLQADLATALADGSISVAYQPIVSLGTGEVTGAEALARWTHPYLGPISPEVFVPLAESTGQIAALGRAVLRTACQQLAVWQHEHDRSGATGGPRRSVSVNVSVRELQGERYAAEVAELLEGAGADPAGLVLEVTESLALDDARHAVGQLEHLRGLGVRVAVDDFGSGHASLHQLRRLPVDILKVDRTLLTGAVSSASERAVFHSIVQLGAALDLVVVAEGIETVEQLRLCEHLGVHLGQGWHLGRPGPALAIGAGVGPTGGRPVSNVLPFPRHA